MTSEALPPEVDPDLVFEVRNRSGLHYLLGNPHTFTGRIAAWSQDQHIEVCVSLSEMTHISAPARYWINGFLAGSEPPPPASDNDAAEAAWESARRAYRATGEWSAGGFHG